MEQLQLGFSDSTQKPASDRTTKWNKMHNYNQILSHSQISLKYWSGHLDPFYIQYKNRPIGEHLKRHADELEAALKFLKLHICQIIKKSIIEDTTITCMTNLLLNHEHFGGRIFGNDNLRNAAIKKILATKDNKLKTWPLSNESERASIICDTMK